MKKVLFPALALLALLSATSIQAQDAKSIWTTLAKVTFKKQYDEMLGFKVDVPVFSPDIKSMDGKIVEIRGYIIPVEGYRGHKEFVFSAFPYNMCFFCGGAGPETVMEVYAKEPIKYTTEAIVIKGKLDLNADDVNRLMYGLKDAELVKTAAK
jgi:hypothetical protein